jgi:hypothetical protein
MLRVVLCDGNSIFTGASFLGFLKIDFNVFWDIDSQSKFVGEA